MKSTIRLFNIDKLRYFSKGHSRFDMKTLSKVSGGFRTSTSSEHFSITTNKKGKLSEIWIDEDGTISMD